MSNQSPGVALRQAVRDDIDCVRDMVRAFCREEAPAMVVSERRLSDNIALCIQHGGVMLSCANGEPVGTIGLTADAPYWSERLWLIGLWAYVRPAHRKEPHMRTMLNMALSVSRDRHMPLRLEVWGGPRTAGKSHLFARELGGPAGALFFARG